MKTKKNKTSPGKKIKKIIKSLKVERSDLKEQKKKLDKKIKNRVSAKGKKAKVKELKSELKKVSKKEAKLKSKLKSRKSEYKRLIEESIHEKENKQNSGKNGVVENTPESGIMTVNTNGQPGGESVPVMPDKNSLGMNTRDAIRMVRKMTDINFLDQFVAEDQRITIVKAANSRKNALQKQIEKV